MMLRKIAIAAEAVELAPWPPIGMTVRPQVAQPQLTAIVTMRVGTKVRGGIHGTRTPVARGHRLRPYRRGWGGRHGLLLTQRTGGLARQACKGLGLAGAFASG